MIKVLKKGLYTSIQDLGRRGYRNYGVPISGMMDSHSAKLSNLILGNEENNAFMEITLQGPKMEFLTTTRIAITGANLSPVLNNLPIDMNKSISIHKGDIIDFGARESGVRSYLAVAGGFQTDLVLGSRSYYADITEKAILEDNELIPFNSSFSRGLSQYAQLKTHSTNLKLRELEVHKGPEFEMLNDIQKKYLLSKNFTLGINSRMAYQLQEHLNNELKSILSSAVLPGTVQLTPSGKMIILMKDCQTTGGYPRVLQLTEQAICCLAQKMQNDTVNFKLKEQLHLKD